MRKPRRPRTCRSEHTQRERGFSLVDELKILAELQPLIDDGLVELVDRPDGQIGYQLTARGIEAATHG